MNLFLNQLVSTIFQVILFGCIPTIWWLISRKKSQLSFREFLGITKINTANKQKLVVTSIVSLLIFLTIGYVSIQSVSDTSILANSQFINFNLWTIPAIILYAFVQTAFSEELFFRGFLAKRLIKTFGYPVGNLLQAFLFGLTHTLMLLTQSTNILFLVLLGIFTGVIGYIMCYLNEKLAGGSIIPSWLVHSLANVVSSLFLILFFS